MIRTRTWATMLLAIGLLGPHLASAQTFTEPGFAAQTVVSVPPFQVVGMTWSNDGTMFIWQKNGLVRIYHDGVLHTTPFLDFRGRVNTYDDRGMLGLALDPDFENNGYVYLAYVYEPLNQPSNSGPKTSRVTRVTANPANPDVMLPGSEIILLDNVPADSGSHNIGTLRFAPDGTLFVSSGEGATAAFADPLALGAQDLDSPRGKILRINPDGSAPSPPQATNPFYDGTNSIRSKVYAYGLRNSFRYDIHPTLGTLYACDVGWNTTEEVNKIVPGGNYGWPCYEGTAPEPSYQAIFPQVCGSLPPSAVVPPLYSYDRFEGSAVVGGAFYTGGVYPQEFTNNFFFSDYTGGWMRRLVLDAQGNIAQNHIFATDIGVPVSTEVGPDGLLYFADFVTGAIRRILHNGPVAAAAATPVSGYSPLQMNFSSAGSTGNAITYFWEFGDGGTSTAPNPTHTYTSGTVQTFVAQLTVEDAADMTATATASVTVGSLAPSPTIQTPANGVGVEPGTTVSFSGTATDPDETLPANALTWEVLLHHNEHIHSHVGGTGYSGSFAAEYHGIGTYSYELILTATDSSGLVASASVQIPILPDTTAPTNPTGLGAVASSSSSIDLSWTASSDNAAVSSYRVERCTGASCGNFAEVAVSPDTTYTDFGVSPLTSYRYRVRASDPSENLSGYSNTASVQTPDGPPQQAGLVLAFGFDEGDGSSVADVSGNANHGSIGGASWTLDGRHGTALSFDGVNDLVLVPDSDSLDLTNGMTIDAWVYPTASLVSWKSILQKEVDAYFLNGSTDQNRVGTGGTFGGLCCTVMHGPTGLPAGQWTHVAGTYDGATLRLYLNGTLAESQAQTGSLEVNGGQLRIGGNTYANEFFSGRIDDVRVYNRALSQSEIQSDMNTPVLEPHQVPAVHPLWVALALGLSGSGLLARRSAAGREAPAAALEGDEPGA